MLRLLSSPIPSFLSITFPRDSRESKFMFLLSLNLTFKLPFGSAKQNFIPCKFRMWFCAFSGRSDQYFDRLTWNLIFLLLLLCISFLLEKSFSLELWVLNLHIMFGVDVFSVCFCLFVKGSRWTLSISLLSSVGSIWRLPMRNSFTLSVFSAAVSFFFVFWKLDTRDHEPRPSGILFKAINFSRK